MLWINGRLINPAHITSAEVETTHYMNGTRSWLVVRFADGSHLREEHGHGFNAWDALGKIDAATSMAEATKTL